MPCCCASDRPDLERPAGATAPENPGPFALWTDGTQFALSNDAIRAAAARAGHRCRGQSAAGRLVHGTSAGRAAGAVLAAGGGVSASRPAIAAHQPSRSDLGRKGGVAVAALAAQTGV